jgi:hypothetical protein
MSKLSPIDSHAALVNALRSDLGYCACAYEDALPKLREFLQLVADRSDGIEDSEAFQRASVRIAEFLEDNASTGLGSWFVYGLERADLLFHGSNLFDLWVADRGRWLLAGLREYLEPPLCSEEPDD